MNKYRAWDKKNKEMYQVYGWNSSKNEMYICSLPNSAFKGGALHTTHVITRPLDKYILMQSTGLKDKNGVEIFEGDFIKFKHNQMSGRGFVFWNQEVGQWWIKDTREVTKKRGQRYYPFWEDCKYTVYGNIHANPEMLKEV